MAITSFPAHGRSLKGKYQGITSDKHLQPELQEELTLCERHGRVGWWAGCTTTR